MSVDDSILGDYDAKSSSGSDPFLTPMSSLPALRTEAKRFLKFGTVGAIGAIVDYSVLNLLIFGAGWSGTVGMAVANILSTSAAIVSNFIWNRSWTFSEAKAENGKRQFLQFVAVSLVGLLLGSFIFLLVNQFIFSRFLSEVLAIQASKACAIGLVMFWNFFANRMWTFRINSTD